MPECTGMHKSTADLLKFFQYQHLPVHLKFISQQCSELANLMATTLPESPETTVGMRKLLEAKDCFVRANVRPGDHCGTAVDGGETYKP